MADIKYLDKTGLGTVKSILEGLFAPKSHKHTVADISNFPSSLPASDVYNWAKAATKPSYSFSEINPGVATIGDGANRLMFRTHESYRNGMYYSTPGNEALVFATKNSVTSWIFATTDPNTQTAWNSLTPSLQIKNGRVTINKLIPEGGNASYNLDVNGSANATTLYENGTRVSIVGHNHDDRYYTESEIDTKLAGKSNTGHGHSGIGDGALVHMCSLQAKETYNAYKIITNWNKASNYMPTINIRGYAYGSQKTIDCDIVMYHYNSEPCNYSITNKGSYDIKVYSAIENNVQVFYIEPGEYFGMFNVFVYGGMGTENFSGWTMETASAVSGTELPKNAIATNVTGNAGSATKLETARTLTIGNSGKSFNGQSNISWTLAEIGAAAAHSHPYLPLSGGTMNSDANISWEDRGAWNNASATYPYSYGGLYWKGTSDWIKLYSKEEDSDKLNLFIEFGDDDGHDIKVIDNGGTPKTVCYTGHTHTKANITDFPTSLPASDVYSWAKAANKPSYNFGEIGAGIATIGDGANRLMFRTDASWASGMYYQTTADEAMVFMNKGKNDATNYTTSWIFAYGNPADRSAWNTLTPAMQIKGDSVVINKLLGSKVGASYNLDVNGSANATTLYENGTRVSVSGHTHDDRYYTETEINTKLAGKSDTGHTHTKSQITDFPASLPANGGNADTVGGKGVSDFARFYLSPMSSGAPADSAKSWFTDTMPSGSGAIVYNVPGAEKTIIAGKSSGAFGHMLQLNYDDNYLRILRYYSGSWKTTDWEKISAGYADTAGSSTYAARLGDSSSYYTKSSLDTALSGKASAHDHPYFPITGGSLSGDNRTIGSTMGGGTDSWSIGGYGTGDTGECRITIKDNANDIFAIQIEDYTGTTYRPLVVESGNVTGTKFTGPLVGNVTGNCSGSSGSCTGNAATATNATNDSDGNVINSTYLKLSGGTLSGELTFGDGAQGMIKYGTHTASGLKGITLPGLGSAGIGIFSRAGKSTDEGGIIITEDSCLIYNSFDAGWGFSIHDKDLNQSDISSDDTKVFGITQDKYYAWSRGGYKKEGSSDSYLLLGGGGHKAISDFLTSLPSHNHDDRYYTESEIDTKLAGKSDTTHTHSYLPTTSSMLKGYGGSLVGYHGENGWHRIAEVNAGSYGYGSYLLYLCGSWNHSANTTAILAIDTTHTNARITQLSGYLGFINKIRLVNVSSNKYYVDIHINYSDNPNHASDTPGSVYYYFLTNANVTVTTAVTKITETVTASAEITLKDGGFANYATSAGSAPASDVYSWAKAASKPSYNFDEIGAGVATIGDGSNRIMFRTNNSYKNGIYYSTPGNEALVFGTVNPVTSWIFATTDPTSQTAWTSLTPSLQIKNGKVAINKLIASGVEATYNLEVNGNINASNGFFDTSDERLKDFYDDIDVDFDKLKAIPKKYFSWKNDENKEIHLGTSAQEIQKVYPEIVNESADGELSVDYSKLSVVALAAVDKLYDKINKIEQALIDKGIL